MKKLMLIIILLITISISACAPSLEEGPCTKRIEFEYETTRDWWKAVNEKATTYNSYSEYTEAYIEPLEKWQALEPTTTCDEALIDLMIAYMTMDPKDENKETIMEEIIFFDLDIAHTGK